MKCFPESAQLDKRVHPWYLRRIQCAKYVIYVIAVTPGTVSYHHEGIYYCDFCLKLPVLD